MPFTIKLRALQRIIASSFFGNEGDGYEQAFWPYLKERFPNCEEYWRYIVVPTTNRIDPTITTPQKRIQQRPGIDARIQAITAHHYSMFLNLCYAYDHLKNFRLSSFEDFYSHLGSACDLAEEFLLKTYFLILNCTGKIPHVLTHLTKDEFLLIAGQWYDKNYQAAYDHYLNKGKPPPMKLPSRNNVLDEYFGQNPHWKQYKRETQSLREYRNVIIHQPQIGKLISFNDVIMVPKRRKIQQYKTWGNVFSVQGNVHQLRSDFINMREQMIIDIGLLEKCLNDIWNVPLDKLKTILFKQRNVLLQSYLDLSIT